MAKIKDLKVDNLNKIRSCLSDGNIWTKNALAEKTSLSLATTTNMLQILLKRKEILYIGEARSTGGRKSKQYQLNQDYAHILCVLLHKKDNQEGLVIQRLDLCGHLLEEMSSYVTQMTPELLIEILLHLKAKDALLEYIALSIPGVCEDGKTDFSDLKTFHQLDLKALVEEKCHLHFLMENDVNAACLGFLNQHTHVQHLTLIYQPQNDAVGCGQVINRSLYRGYSHFAGELGFLPFDNDALKGETLQRNPQLLLEKQIETLCCVFNPEYVVIYSEVLKDKHDFNLASIPINHQPKIDWIEDIDKLILTGLYQLALDHLKEKDT